VTGLAAFVDGLPKAELHLHLESSCSASRKFQSMFLPCPPRYSRHSHP
jgi:hypothetical protein